MCIQHDVEFVIPKNIAEAVQIQNSIAMQVRIAPLKLKRRLQLVAGVDAAFFDGNIASAASLFTYPEMQQVEDSLYRGKASFPYIPGFFSFREGPAALRALLGLKIRPDVVLVDGQGMAHPRGAGIAAHLGVMLDLPTIGCAKSRLTGQFNEPGKTKGDWSYLYRTAADRSPIGAVVRTRTGVKPVFVSPGHLIDITSAVDIVLGCLSAYRIPEPLRRADNLSRRMRRRGKKGSRSDLL